MVARKGNSPTKYTLDLVALHITRVCSHRCPYCYAADDLNKPTHPPFEQLLRVVDAIADANVEEITLLGGDPAPYPKSVDLAAYIHGKGIRVSVLSNTHRYPNSSIAEAAKYISAFEATIHDATPEKHDEFCRSPGAYARVMGQLRMVAGTGRKIGIALNVTPQTVTQMYRMVQRMVSRDRVRPDYVIVQRIIPFGRASGSSDFTLSREIAERALQEIRRIDDELGIKIAVEDPFPLCVLPKELRKYMTPCAWGFTKAAVSANGDLSRCGADPRYRLGNILEKPLLQIWNESEILKSFRSREYLPGRCRACTDMEQCGGGCPLSCEIEKDHGVDYLFLEYEKLDQEIHGAIVFDHARHDELSSMLQIEWSDFPEYGHLFSVDSIKFWYSHNPAIFRVVRDARNWVLGYAAIVPITKTLFESIKKGRYSALTDFPLSEVLLDENTEFFHVEVVAAVPSRTASRAGRELIKNVGTYLAERAKYIAASPITNVGLRLCKYFDFEHVSYEKANGRKYPIYILAVDKEKLMRKVAKF
jgi:radical SAM protein with 4Fe4S-binding SPASM domain